ncbi:MAG: beta-hydroxyacyl-ACP dehydratase [Proteobacteria bacterium]|nr:beta-hydroxyacyl-ACP dehydratase [Pseudomonadota bacterium]
MQQLKDIFHLIPHRPPFLWIERIISCADDWIITEKFIPPDLDIFQGHYPGNPIMPGVILCEAIFQSGALLIAKRNLSLIQEEPLIPVLTRIVGAKFKKSVFPGDTINIKVTLTEAISNACFFKGTLKVDGKVAVIVDFACTLVRSTS